MKLSDIKTLITSGTIILAVGLYLIFSPDKDETTTTTDSSTNTTLEQTSEYVITTDLAMDKTGNKLVDYYVRMNFHAFIDIVDALGGIEAEVPYSIVELDENDKRVVQLEKGVQKLDGTEALALARTRKKDSDIERGKRQQAILKAIASQAAKPSSILKYDDIIDAVADNTKTNMTFGEMKSFLSYLSSGMPRIDSLYLAGEDDWSTGVYYYKLDDESLDETIYTLKNHLGLEKSANMNQKENDSTDENQSIGDFSIR